MSAILNGLIILFAFLWFGELIHNHWLHNVPAPAVGMAMLLVFASALRGRLKGLQSGASFLISWLSLFFLPVATGMWFIGDAIEGQWLPILAACIPATIIAQMAVGWLAASMLSAKGE